MNSFLKNLSAQPLQWLSLNAPLTEVVISSRIRLARNLADEMFPSKMDEIKGLDAMEIIFEACSKLPQSERLCSFELNTLNEIEKDLLLERRHITHNSVFSSITGIVLDEDDDFSILVNDEDHVHLQVIRPGLELHKSWDYITHIDTLLNKEIDYEFCNDRGFLTSSPKNVGTGMRASVQLDLSGTYLTGQLSGIVQAARVSGYRLHGTDGQDESSRPGRYLISTTQTLGVKEEELLYEFEVFVREVVDCELRARRKLLADSPYRPLNLVSRAYGALKYSWLLDEDEAFDRLMTLRFGLQLGIFEYLTFERLELAITYSCNSHLQQVLQEALSTEDLNRARALLVRKNIGLDI